MVVAAALAASCPSTTTLYTVGGVPMRQLNGESTFYYLSDLDVDADGSPNAYAPNNTGIDYLGNAGSPGNWWGIATDSSGTPYVQGQYPAGSYAPYPGFYVSTTSLEDSSYASYDVRRYANAVNVTFFVLPSGKSCGARLGDLAYIYWTKDGRSAFAMYADVGPSSSIGEGSVALHESLGNNPYSSSGRVVNGIDGNTVYTLVFPGSGTGKLLSQQDVNKLGSNAFEAWGGSSRFQSCILGH